MVNKKFVVLLGVFMSSLAFGQEATQKVGEVADKAVAFLASYESIMVFVLGMIVSIAKRVSNEKAGPVIAGMQKVLDMVPFLLEKLGAVLKSVCDLLAKAIKSDGFLGKP